MSNISQNAEIKSATLSLYVTASMADSGRSMILYPLVRDWNEDEVTYLNAKADTPWENMHEGNEMFGIDTIYGGGDIDNDSKYRVVSSPVQIGYGYWMEFDVSTIVKKMVENPGTFTGFNIYEGRMSSYNLGDPIGEHEYDTTGSGSYNTWTSFASSEYPTIENRPKLTINFGVNILSGKVQKENHVQLDQMSDRIRINNSSNTLQTVSFVSLNGRTLGKSVTVAAGATSEISTESFSPGVILVRMQSSNGLSVQKLLIH